MTPIQAQSLPDILKGKDLLAQAKTGSGKTAAFAIGLLHRLEVQTYQTQSLVLCPTRELAEQVSNEIRRLARAIPNTKLLTLCGGKPMAPQLASLERAPHIVVGTPGRILKHLEKETLKLDGLNILVLDEADRMLDMGFIHDIKKIMALLPKQRQNLMFSATFSQEIRQLAKGIINNPVEIDVAPRNSTVETIAQKIHPVDKTRKVELLSHLIRRDDWYQVLVFSRTKHGSDKLVKRLLRDNINAAAIHGNKSQPQRTKVLDSFKRNKIQVLVATDIAARGIDIDQLSHVVNFDLPNVPEDYVHRIGRTGRAGASGHAISLVSADEIKQLQDIERLIKSKIEREEIENFEPQHLVPESVSAKSSRNKQRANPGNNKTKKYTGKRKVSSEQGPHSRYGKPNRSSNRNNNSSNRSRRSSTAEVPAV